MIEAFRNSWALLLGMFLLMIGNGVQGTLLGIRGDLEGFSTFELSLVMSAYFAGFLGGSQAAPALIRQVGHIRVFAALASFISAVLILYPSITDPIAWIALRVIFGFCMSGVYVTAESWLNAGARNDIRGQTLSLYLLAQMAGVTAAQGLPLFGDPSGFALFIIPSVLVSVAVAPILLTATPTPAFATAKPMSLRRLYRSSPLGFIGTLLMGGVYSALFGMASVYGTQAGLSVQQISIFIAVIYLGGTVLQFPIGWLSDRMDRRRLIMLTAVTGAAGAVLPVFAPGYPALLMAAFIIGGMSNPLYGLLLAHTNDFLEYEDMASASGQLLFINGSAAVVGPVITGFAISTFGSAGFFVMLAVLMGGLGVYAAYRATQRAAPEDTGDFASVLPTSSLITLEAAQESYAETEEEPWDELEPVEPL